MFLITVLVKLMAISQILIVITKHNLDDLYFLELKINFVKCSRFEDGNDRLWDLNYNNHHVTTLQYCIDKHKLTADLIILHRHQMLF